MSTIVVVYHSGYGHTERVALALASAARARPLAINADGEISPADWALLDAAPAIVFGSPTYMGMVSWQFKRFADASSTQWLARSWRNKWAGGFTVASNTSGDKLSTLQYLHILAMQHGMLWVGQAEPHTAHTLTDGVNRMGSSIGVMAQCHPAAPACAIPQGDIDTASTYGQRLFELVSNQRR